MTVYVYNQCTETLIVSPFFQICCLSYSMQSIYIYI